MAWKKRTFDLRLREDLYTFFRRIDRLLAIFFICIRAFHMKQSFVGRSVTESRLSKEWLYSVTLSICFHR